MHSNKLKLVLINGKCRAGGPQSALYEQVFDLWKSTWTKVFTDVGSPGAFNPDAFFRGDVIPTLFFENEILGFYVATTYSLHPAVTHNHSYFSIFPESAVQDLTARGARDVVSYEFMTGLPAWKQHVPGISLANVFAQLGSMVRDDLGCDTGVGVARIEKKVNRAAHNVGGFTLEAEVRRGNLVCELMGFRRENDKLLPNPEELDLALSLWEQRTYVDKFGQQTVPNKIQIAA